MVNVSPRVAVHQLAALDVPVRLLMGDADLAVEPHPEGWDWEADALSADPGQRCVALVETDDDARACHAEAVLVFAITTAIPGHLGRFHLCGEHYAAHRRGEIVRLVL